MNIQELAEQRRIFTCRAGSIAYNLNIETSDEDLSGVFVGAPENVFGMFPVEHCQYHGDYIVYELRKFIGLARDCNPNIIELLFVDESDILFSAPSWNKLRSHRDLFLTKRAKDTFSGYAMAQLKKIRGHNRWLHNPQPREKPSPAKYLKTKHIEGLGHREVFDQIAYDQALKGWKGYWEWKKNRNPKRSLNEEELGFDGKHALHLIRLARMGNEILRGEGVQVKRADRDDLLSIRRGDWTFEQITAHADELMEQMESLAPEAPLPDAPDVRAINDLMLEIYRDEWRERGEI